MQAGILLGGVSTHLEMVISFMVKVRDSRVNTQKTWDSLDSLWQISHISCSYTRAHTNTHTHCHNSTNVREGNGELGIPEKIIRLNILLLSFHIMQVASTTLDVRYSIS